MKIEIWSDIACPYCYIGKRKLEEALNNFPHKNNIELVWHSYELDPDLPKEALESKIYGYFADKHNMSVREAEENMGSIAALAKEVGLDFDFENLQVANTSDALRLVKLAKEVGLATETEEVLFDAYFVKGLDISDRRTLLTLGTSVGLKQEEIEKMLDSDKYLDEIKKDIRYGEDDLGLEYIPMYLINNKQIIQGSIAVEDYLRVITEAYGEWEKSGVSTFKGEIITGKSCSIDGVCD